MTRRKRFLLVLVLLVLLSQIPFAYRRYKLVQLHATIQQLNSQRVLEQSDSAFAEYKGVIHVHSFLGGHSTGTFEEIIAAANANELNFVIMTEHTAKNFNTAEMTLKGLHAGVLFLNGNEVTTSTQDRLLVIPGGESGRSRGDSLTQDFPAYKKTSAGLTFVAYPQEFKSWDASSYDGLEVYNVFANARSINPLTMFFDGIWSYGSYPELLFARFFSRPTENLHKWDETISKGNRRLIAIAGNDAHSNIGVSLNDSSGKILLDLKLDPYERSFRLVRNHALLPKGRAFTEETLLTALSAGHCFIGFDLFSDSSGFRFTASNASETKIQGDEINLNGGVNLAVNTPLSSRMVLRKDGNVIQEQSGIFKKEFAVSERGVYRVEIYLPQLPEPLSNQPWIISNPIYVR
jgi:hypothetical protein